MSTEWWSGKIVTVGEVCEYRGGVGRLVEWEDCDCGGVCEYRVVEWEEWFKWSSLGEV